MGLVPSPTSERLLTPHPGSATGLSVALAGAVRRDRHDHGDVRIILRPHPPTDLECEIVLAEPRRPSGNWLTTVGWS